MSKRSRPKPPEMCPVCGDEVPRNALACGECGADHNSGWRTDADVNDALGGTDEDFDYEEFVRNEFGKSAKPRGIGTVWWITALLLLLALVLAYWL